MSSQNIELEKWIQVLDNRDNQATKAIENLARIGSPEAVEPLINYVTVMRNYRTELIANKAQFNRKSLHEKYGIHSNTMTESDPTYSIATAENALVEIGDLRGIRSVLEGENPLLVLSALEVVCKADPIWQIKLIERFISDPNSLYGFAQTRVHDVKIHVDRNGTQNEHSKKLIDERMPKELISTLINVLNGNGGKLYIGVSALAALALSREKDDPTIIQTLREMLNNVTPKKWLPNDTYGFAPRCFFIFPGLGNSISINSKPLAECAAVALIRLHDTESIAQIVNQALSEDWSKTVFQSYKYMFMDGLEMFISEIVRVAQESSDTAKVEKAVKSLAVVGDSSVIQPLISLLNNKNQKVLKLAIQALGEIGDSNALEGLQKQANDGNFFIRNDAKNAIKKIEKRRAK